MRYHTENSGRNKGPQAGVRFLLDQKEETAIFFGLDARGLITSGGLLRL
jgi:hypothetical protein